MGSLIVVFDSLLETPEERKRERFPSPRVSCITSEIPISSCAGYDQAVEINLKREIRVSGKSHTSIADVYRSKTKHKYHMVETTGAVLHKYTNLSSFGM